MGYSDFITAWGGVEYLSISWIIKTFKKYWLLRVAVHQQLHAFWFLSDIVLSSSLCTTTVSNLCCCWVYGAETSLRLSEQGAGQMTVPVALEHKRYRDQYSTAPNFSLNFFFFFFFISIFSWMLQLFFWLLLFKITLNAISICSCSPDITLCGWLGSKHQLTICS